MAEPRILISGAGVAGPALAYCLARSGYHTTVVERAPALREGGQAVDFRGPVQRTVLERLDLWDAIWRQRTHPNELCLVDQAGVTRARMPEVMLAGDVEIVRGDLCRILYERTVATTDYRFAERVVGLQEGSDSVSVEFERGGTETFDLVIGADGLHSGVRALAFGDEARFLRHQGYRIATFGMTNPLGTPRGSACYSEPRRGVCVSTTSAGLARALLVYTARALGPEDRDVSAQKEELMDRFRSMGWLVPRVLGALADAEDLYVDAIATVHVDRYSTGRIGLLGDAAWGGTLGGQGTSVGIVGAYVLAHELARGTEPAAAFARYEARLRPYATRCQRGAMRVGGFFAPRTGIGLGLRDFCYRVLTSKPLSGIFERLVTDAASDFALPQ
jgi:2-polyprenyl-6-methoxyphenol hydroxylase-like FAD-dependent oxidoreductase